MPGIIVVVVSVLLGALLLLLLLRRRLLKQEIIPHDGRVQKYLQQMHLLVGLLLSLSLCTELGTLELRRARLKPFHSSLPLVIIAFFFRSLDPGPAERIIFGLWLSRRDGYAHFPERRNLISMTKRKLVFVRSSLVSVELWPAGRNPVVGPLPSSSGWLLLSSGGAFCVCVYWPSSSARGLSLITAE